MGATYRSKEFTFSDLVRDMSGNLREIDVLTTLTVDLLWEEEDVKIQSASPATGTYDEFKKEVKNQVGPKIFKDTECTDGTDLVVSDSQGRRFIEAKGHQSRECVGVRRGYAQIILGGDPEKFIEGNRYGLALPADAICELWDEWTTQDGKIPWGLEAQIEKAEREGVNLQIYLITGRSGEYKVVSWRSVLEKDFSDVSAAEAVEMLD